MVGRAHALRVVSHSGFFDEAKVLILDTKRVRGRYMRGWFAFDLISSIPVQILILIDRGTFENLIALKMIRLLKLGRLSRVNRIKVRPPIVAVSPAHSTRPCYDLASQMLRDLSYNGYIKPGVVRLVRWLIDPCELHKWWRPREVGKRAHPAERQAHAAAGSSVIRAPVAPVRRSTFF